MKISCLHPSNLLLPSVSVNQQKWSVIACDQYTSQPEYWQQAESIIAGAPSTYYITYPEIYLQEQYGRTDAIHSYMKEFLQKGVLEEQVHNGFILTERQTSTGIRIGLVGALDLEQYEFQENISAPVRATEGTITSRIPPRMLIRKGACLETSHVMVLLDDKKRQIIETIYKEKSDLRKLYDFDLMLHAGHIRGYAIEGRSAALIAEQIALLQTSSDKAVMAVGDGNHSLAAAKAHWMQLKKNLSSEQQSEHPARYALVEVVNLYSEAIIFEPIHRIVFHADLEQVLDEFENFLHENNIDVCVGNDITFLSKTGRTGYHVESAGEAFAVGIVQQFLDKISDKLSKMTVDYIHGEENVRALLSREEEAVGILLNGIEKEKLFPAIQGGKVLPRKTFSMGEADDKRFYLECRKIIE